jgi:hypothetical protein
MFYIRIGGTRMKTEMKELIKEKLKTHSIVIMKRKF